MKISDNTINILAAKTFRGIGRAWVVKHLGGNESPENIVALLNTNNKEPQPVTLEGFEKTRQQIRQQLAALSGFADGVVALGDADFPPHRGNVKNSEKPVVLFYRGDLALLGQAQKNIAVIGLLTPDSDTETAEAGVVLSLVNKGATVVSGLAMGCDTIAHRQTLLSGGKTVAILPGPLNDILPHANQGLADEIVAKQGLLVSEYFDKANSKMELGGRYQERDRLQALFSDCVVLAASYAKNDLGNDSGSRLAMEYAHNYGLPRAVLYDELENCNNPKYDLNRQLMREDGGITVISRQNREAAIGKILSCGSKPATAAQATTENQGDLFG